VVAHEVRSERLADSEPAMWELQAALAASSHHRPPSNCGEVGLRTLFWTAQNDFLEQNISFWI